MENAIKNVPEAISQLWNTPKGAALYCIVDAAVSDDLPEHLWRLVGKNTKAASLISENSDDYLAVSPFLLELKEPDALYHYLLNICRTIPMGIFLISREPWIKVTEEATAWLWPRKQSGEQVLFRYYDPRVFSSLLQYTKKSHQPLAVGSFTDIVWHDPLKEKSFHFKSTQGKAFSCAEPWLLEPDLEEWLMESQVPHRIMDMLKNADAELCRKYQGPQLFQKIEAHLLEASAFNILELKDLLRFSHLSLLFPGFTKHEIIRHSLIEHRKYNGLKPFNDLVSSWNPSWLTPYTI